MTRDLMLVLRTRDPNPDQRTNANLVCNVPGQIVLSFTPREFELNPIYVSEGLLNFSNQEGPYPLVMYVDIIPLDIVHEFLGCGSLDK